MNGHMYVVNDKTGKRAKEVFTILGVLESFGILRFKSLGGSHSQIYIYVNETKTMTMVRDRPYVYKNKLLELINNRHKESVKMLTYLFQNEFSSEQVWDYLEDYFLGILPEALVQDGIKEDLSDLETAVVRFQTGNSPAEDYGNWKRMGALFENDIIRMLGDTNVPLADYYNAKLMIGQHKIEVNLAWLSQRLLLTGGEEEEMLRKTAKQSGWTCIPMEDISMELLQSYLR